MNKEEKELDELVNNIKSEKKIQHLPYFETFVTLLSLSIAFMLFLAPELMDTDRGRVYGWLLKIMPQFMWAFSFFGAGLFLSVGLSLDNKTLRTLGLVMTSLLFLAFTVCFSTSFPSVSALVYAWITIYTVVSLAEVKHTRLAIKGVKDQ